MYCLDYLYTYKLISGEEQKIPVKVYVIRLEFRRKPFMKTLLFNKTRDYIVVEPSKKIGEMANISDVYMVRHEYMMKKGEDAMQTIMRMERERRFNR